MCAPVSRQFGERLLQSLEYLQFKARSHNAIAACDSIAAIVSDQEKYALYRDMFPKEWSRSRASLHRRGYYQRYSERANELFQLIHENCFPLLEIAHDDPEGDLESFAIAPMNADLCCEEIDHEHLRISYAVGLVFFFRDETWAFLDEKFGLDQSDFPAIRNEPHGDVWQSEGSVYGDLIRLIDHSTGNPWLDSTYCQTADWYTWSRETIEDLTFEFRNANALFARLSDLDPLIEARPNQILTDLINFWNTGVPWNPTDTSSGDKTNEQE